MSLYLGIPLLILVAVFQSSVLPHISILGLVPNLMLLVVIGWGFQRGPNEGMVWAMIGGLALDLASGSPIGVSPPPLMVAALVAGVGRTQVFQGNVVLLAFITLLALALFQVFYLALLVLAGRELSWRVAIWEVGFPLLLLHLVLMPIVYLCVAWLARLVRGPRVRLG